MLGKIIIHSTLTVKTGLHIGNSDAFSPIGATDSPIIKDMKTALPIVPGSSLKGKIRTLLARSESKDITKMNPCNKDSDKITRLFGCSEPIKFARLQFADAFISNVEEMKTVGFTEVKAENTIDRITSSAMPRTIERVNPGTKFDVCISYNVENEGEIIEDMKVLTKGIKLLQLDYLGGHGSRGSGRVSFGNFSFEQFDFDGNIDEVKKLFAEVEEYELLSV